MRFMHEERSLPVVWHQSLLVFIQRQVKMSSLSHIPCLTGSASSLDMSVVRQAILRRVCAGIHLLIETS